MHLEHISALWMKFDCRNKLDFCDYGQVNSLRLKSSVASILLLNPLKICNYIIKEISQKVYSRRVTRKLLLGIANKKKVFN